MAALTIRRAGPSDIPEIVRLLVELFGQEAEFAPAPDRHARGLAAIIADERVGKILIAEDDGRIAGMVNFLYTVSTALGGRVAHLEDVVVAKAMRGERHRQETACSRHRDRARRRVPPYHAPHRPRQRESAR